MKDSIKVGAKVSFNGGKGKVVAINGRWVKVKIDGGGEKNFGFSALSIVDGPKNGVVDPKRRAMYVVTKINGETLLDNGDDVATALRGMSLDDVYKVAADVLDMVPDELRKQYKHLNNGMQRMNLGNRIRKAVKNNPELMKYVK